MRTLAIPSVVVLGLTFLPEPAEAQLDLFNALVRRVDNLSFYGILGRSGFEDHDDTSASSKIERGIGFELLVLVHEWGEEAESTVTHAPPPRPEPGTACGIGVGCRLTEVVISGRDTTRKYVPAPQHEERPWALELGLAYNDRPFTIDSDGYEISGTLRDFPAITLYASRELPIEGLEAISPYLGIRLSSFSLASGRAFLDTDTITRSIPLGASTLARGITFGLSVSVADLVSAYGEFEISRRRFNVLQWPDNIPPRLPKHLDIGSTAFWVGGSVHIGTIFN